jgi:hypothetical protein
VQPQKFWPLPGEGPVRLSRPVAASRLPYRKHSFAVSYLSLVGGKQGTYVKPVSLREQGREVWPLITGLRALQAGRDAKICCHRRIAGTAAFF